MTDCSNHDPRATTITETIEGLPGFERNVVITTTAEFPHEAVRRHEEAVLFYKRLKEDPQASA